MSRSFKKTPTWTGKPGSNKDTRNKEHRARRAFERAHPEEINVPDHEFVDTWYIEKWIVRDPNSEDYPKARRK